MALPVAAIGIGALVLLAMGKKKPASVSPNSQGTTAGSGGGGGGNVDPKTAVGIVGGSVGLVTQIVGAAVGGGSGGGAAASAPASASIEIATAGTSASSIGGVVVEAVGGSLIIIGIVAAVVMLMVIDAVTNMNAAVANFIRSVSTPNARTFFDAFLAKVSQPVYQNGQKMSVHLPAPVLQQVVRTSLFLGYIGAQVSNDTRRDFLTRMGWDKAHRESAPIIAAFDDYWSQPTVGPLYALPPRNSNQPQTQLMRFVSCLAPDCDFSLVAAPVSSLSDLQGAAMALLGVKYGPLVDFITFQGKCAAIAYAVTSIYTQGFYPGDDKFCTDIRDTVVPDWTIETGTYWTTDKKQVYAVWLIDPVTGNRVAPAMIRGSWSMVTSVKGMEIYPASGSIPATFARFGRRKR